MNTTYANPPPPWWRLPIMWLVVGGPLAVVVASFVTAWLAIDGADPIVPHGSLVLEVARSGAKARGDAPAQQARNHAATPVAPTVPAAPALPAQPAGSTSSRP
jgi:uncharacterized protein